HHIGIASGVGSLGNYLARTEGPTKLGRSRCRWVCANNAPFKRLSSAQACAARARVNLRFRHGCVRGLIEEVRFARDLYGAFPVKRLFLGFAASSSFSTRSCSACFR